MLDTGSIHSLLKRVMQLGKITINVGKPVNHRTGLGSVVAKLVGTGFVSLCPLLSLTNI